MEQLNNIWSFINKKSILAAGILCLLLLLAFTIYRVYAFSGTYVYPLDDSYIHLSIAKNFAQHGVWGITQYEFSSTTSSPFFTLLLAFLIKIFGNWQFIPIILNTVSAVALLFVIHQFLKIQSKVLYAIVIFCTVLLMPLHTMILSGMEHVLHALSLLLCLLFFKNYCKNGELKSFVSLLIFAILATGFRYESLFFILMICAFLFFIKRDYIKSILLGLLALSPVIIYGLISIANGSEFLPNSLILKGNINDGITGFLYRVAGNLYRGLSILPLIALLFYQLIIDFIKYRKGKSLSKFFKANDLQLIVFFGIILHVLFANFGWLYRYEAYLVPLLIISLIPVFSTSLISKSSTLKVVTVAIFLLIPFSYRFIGMMKHETIASKNIYEQQIQIAGFLQKNYNNASVVLNDIGAATYFTDIQLLDTYGLGSIEVAEIRKSDNGKFNRENEKLITYVSNFTRKNNFDIAIVYDSWLKMPADFKKIGSWEITDNYICGNPNVSFYQLKKADSLSQKLSEYNKVFLPKSVISTVNK